MQAIFSAYKQRQTTLEATYTSNPFAQGIAYIPSSSPSLVPMHSARIPILDQGFMRGDMTYDVASVWNGRTFRLNDHLDRIERSKSKNALSHPPLSTENHQSHRRNVIALGNSRCICMFDGDEGNGARE